MKKWTTSYNSAKERKEEKKAEYKNNSPDDF